MNLSNVEHVPSLELEPQGEPQGTGLNGAKLRGYCLLNRNLNPNPNLDLNLLVENGLRLGLRLGL
jgi:hypothetical protein